MSQDDIGAALQRSLRWLSAATVALYLIVIVALALVTFEASAQRAGIRDLAGRNTTALCALRSDLNQRVLSAETSLALVQPVPHTTVEEQTITDLKTSIVNTKRTINALSDLRCG